MGNDTHPKMDRLNRAKQFMPFDALKGFQEALREKERDTDGHEKRPEKWEREGLGRETVGNDRGGRREP